MSSIVDELSKYFSVPFNEVLDYKYTVINNSVVNVTGYKKIINYSTEMVTLSVKKNELIIEGENLKIKELDKGNIVLVGKIYKIYLSKES